MCVKKFIGLFIIVLISFPLLMQAGILKGRVTDNKGPLPYATIYIQGTTTGTGTTANGDYELPLSPGTYKIVCQYMGYKQSIYTATIEGNENITHNFVLEEQHLEIKEVVVRPDGEDPAYRIVRNAIKKREIHLQQVKSFQTGVYMKGVVRLANMPDKFMGQKLTASDKQGSGLDSAGKGVLYVCEEDADYYARGDKEHNVIHSVRESGSPNGIGFQRMLPIITFYENNVKVLEGTTRGYISPISDNALFYYKYKLLGTFQQNGHKIYTIKLLPKRDYEPLFTGTIYIADEDWAIQGMEVLLTKKAGLDMVDSIMIQQTYLPLRPDTWVVQQQVFRLWLALFGFGGNGSFVTVYSKQKVNEPMPDSIFNNKIVSVYDKAANKKDTSYFTEARPIPLEGDEIHYYRFSDSSYKYTHTAEYIDSLRRINNKMKISKVLRGTRFYGKDYKNIFIINGLLDGVNYNAVEGLNLALTPSWIHRIDTGKYLYADAAARYGFSNTHFNTIGRIAYVSNDRSWIGRSWTVGVEGGKYVFQYNPANPVGPFINTLTTLLGGRSILKIYERKEVSAFVSRKYGNGFSWNVKASWQQRLPLDNTTNYSFRKNVDFESNLPDKLKTVTVWEQHDAALLHVGLLYQPGYTYVQYPDYKAGSSKAPVFSITYDKGVPNILNSKVDFDKWSAGIKGDLNLKLLGQLSYNITAGGFLNSSYVSIPDLKHVIGNYGFGLASYYLNSFQLIGYYDYSNKAPIYSEAHLEYNMMGLLSNKIPLLRQARWNLVLGNNTFYETANNYYTEAFIGIDNIGYKLVRVGRVDFIQGWNSMGGRNSGIRIGLNLPGAYNPRFTAGREAYEW